MAHSKQTESAPANLQGPVPYHWQFEENNRIMIADLNQ